MIKGNLKILFISILLISALGCKEKDEVKPTIVLQHPNEGDVISTGSSLAVAVALTDNKELMQYSVILKAREQPLAGNVLPSFSYGDAIAVFGTELTDTVDIVIPSEHAVGTYELEVSATDLAGNNSDEKIIELQMENSLDGTDPQFNVSTLDEAGINTFMPQENISIDGSAQDNRQLGGMRVEIKDLDNNLIELREYQFQSQATNFTNFISAPTLNGTYNLIITVADNVNNQSEKVYTLKVQ